MNVLAGCTKLNADAIDELVGGRLSLWWSPDDSPPAEDSMGDDVCINLSDRLSASFLIAVSSALNRKYIS